MFAKVLIVSSLLTVQAFAAELYVAPNGNDSSSGTEIAPLRTLNRAAQLAREGTTVYVAPGIYNENVRTTVSGSAQSRIRYVSTQKWKAQIVGSGTEASWTNQGSYVDIVNFDISGSGRLGILNNGSQALIQGNHIHDLKISGGCGGGGGGGIDNGNYAASDNDTVGNVVHDIGVPGACNTVQGIYHSNLRGKIANNIVYRVSAYGIHLWHAANNVIITNNTVFNNGSSSIGGGIIIGDGDSPGGVVLDNTRVSNNIVFNNPGVGIIEYCYPGVSCIGSNVAIQNNLIMGSASPLVLKTGTAQSTISLDPQFVNYKADGTGDYHLKSTSPAIDKGVLAFAPTTDIDNVARPQGAGIDIGAYEFAASSPPPPPAQAVLTLSESSMNFPEQLVGHASPIQLLTLKNTGTAAMTIPTGFVISGDFAFGGIGTCSTRVSYAPGSSCTASLIFKPQASGVRTGSITIHTNASSAAVVVPLKGTGTLPAPIVKLSASSVVFPNQKVGTKSAIQLLTIQNVGSAPMTIPTAFVLSGPFAFGGIGTCSVKASYAPGGSCTASLVFKPKATGLQSGSITIRTNASSTSVVVPLSGKGI